MHFVCADGRNYRETDVPGDTPSHTVLLETVLITATSDDFKERDVAVVDVPGAFISAIRGLFAELMAKAAPNIYKNITLDANI
jgi:hypothetical protein